MKKLLRVIFLELVVTVDKKFEHTTIALRDQIWNPVYCDVLNYVNNQIFNQVYDQTEDYVGKQ